VPQDMGRVTHSADGTTSRVVPCPIAAEEVLAFFLARNWVWVFLTSSEALILKRTLKNSS